LRDTSGELRGYAKVLRDRTEQRTFEQALRAREERLRLLLENIRDCAVFDLDRDGQICSWNSGAERIFGYTELEVSGVDSSELFAAAGYSPEAFRRELETAAACGRGEGESWLSRNDGTRFFARWITNTVHSADGNAVGFIKVLRDETVRQQTEDQEQRRMQFAWDLLEQQARRTSSTLGRTSKELSEIGRQLLNVQEEERRRIARDLHDHLAQRLALLEMGLHHLRQGLPQDLGQLQAEVASLQEHTAALCQDVRDISHRLHPSIIEHLGLAKALRSLCDDYRRGGIARVGFEAVDDGSAIPLEVATVFYRICQEALRNTQKHAGDVPVGVQLQVKGTELWRRIQDEGPGFDPDAINAAEHLGLISMRERAAAIGAVCKCISRSGKGSAIEVLLIR
jgi:PAS domain S-box-containing protein